LQKRYTPITAVAVILAVVAIAGYLRPAPAQEAPIRILFDTKGGKVIFSHISHYRDYKMACATCHHESAERMDEPLRCETCHALEYNQEFTQGHAASFADKKFCARCHHAEFGGVVFEHDAHTDDYGADCTDCHHDSDIEPDPGSCMDCHESQGDADMPGLRVAIHTRCEACHSDMYEEGVKGCPSCHEIKDPEEPYTPCLSCHYQSDEQPIPARVNAFHSGCMGCHEENQKGPYSKEDCNMCHIR